MLLRGSWKHPRMETTQLLWVTCLPVLTGKKKDFPFKQFQAPLLPFMTTIFYLLTMHHCEEPNSISLVALARQWQAVVLLGAPKDRMFSRLNQLSCPSCSSWGKCTSPSALGALYWVPPPVCPWLSCAGGPKLVAVRRWGLTGTA